VPCWSPAAVEELHEANARVRSAGGASRQFPREKRVGPNLPDSSEGRTRRGFALLSPERIGHVRHARLHAKRPSHIGRRASRSSPDRRTFFFFRHAIEIIDGIEPSAAGLARGETPADSIDTARGSAPPRKRTPLMPVSE